jgi:hypothetical protein
MWRRVLVCSATLTRPRGDRDIERDTERDAAVYTRTSHRAVVVSGRVVTGVVSCVCTVSYTVHTSRACAVWLPPCAGCAVKSDSRTH